MEKAFDGVCSGGGLSPVFLISFSLPHLPPSSRLSPFISRIPRQRRVIFASFFSFAPPHDEGDTLLSRDSRSRLVTCADAHCSDAEFSAHALVPVILAALDAACWRGRRVRQEGVGGRERKGIECDDLMPATVELQVSR